MSSSFDVRARVRAPVLAAGTVALLLGAPAGLLSAFGEPQRSAGDSRDTRGAHASTERRRLVERRDALRRDTERLRLEADLARTRSTYAVLDPAGRTLAFRVRGRVMKEVVLDRVDVRPPNRPGSVAPEEVFGRVHRLADRIPRDDFIEPEPAGDGSAADGASGGDTAPAPLSPLAMEPPPRFCWKFEDGLTVYVTGNTPPDDPRARRAQKAVALARIVGRGLLDLLRAGSRDTELHLSLSDVRARETFRSLLPGQALILLTPPAGS